MLYKRPGSDLWQIKFVLNGRTIRRSSRTSDKRLAERIEHQAREKIIKSTVDGVKPPFSWGQAVALWDSEKRTKRSLDTDAAIFKSMSEDFKGMDVQQIDSKTISKYRSKIVDRASPSTANRHLSLLRALLRLLERNDIIVKAPNITLFPIETKEPPWITPEQVTAVLNALPPHARDIAEFAVLTGLRRGNVLGLKWSWVDLARALAVVPAVSAKGKRTIPVPLSEPAKAIIERRIGIHPEYVFTGPRHEYGANPMEDGPLSTLKTAWATATKAAGVPGMRFHDLRHAWASFHTMNQTPDRVLQALGGWSSPKMLERYGHLKPGVLAEYAGNVKL